MIAEAFAHAPACPAALRGVMTKHGVRRGMPCPAGQTTGAAGRMAGQARACRSATASAAVGVARLPDASARPASIRPMAAAAAAAL
jgi:hypothetical protein